MFKVWERMSPEEFHAYLIEIGTLNPDGSIPGIYYEEYDGPSWRRPRGCMTNATTDASRPADANADEEYKHGPQRRRD